VALEWYITFLTKQWCKVLQREGTVSLKKRGPRRLPRYLSLISTPELAIGLVRKAHVIKNENKFEFFPSRGSNSADRLLYLQEARDMHKFNYVQC